MLTRGVTFSEYQKKLSFWLHGPEFLSKEPLHWPTGSTGCLSLKSKQLLTCVTTNKDIASIFPVDRYSDINKLLKVTVNILKFVSSFKYTRDIKDINLEAKLYWIKHEQNIHYSEEINFLKSPSNSNVPPTVKNLNLFLDEHSVIRCKGRLEKTNLNYDVCNPILLPRNSFLTDLYVYDAHNRCKHLGIASTLNYLRSSGFWIPKGRAKVKSILHKCITCKKINALPFKYPKQTSLIKDRVTFEKPYQHVGIDFTGHVYIKFNEILVKMYILVFTCMNVRAVHLELLPSMTCADFLMAFIRFCNIYNIPDSVYSDNASTFLQAMGIISGSHTDNEFTDYLTKNNIKHIRIPLYSAWVGSYWERMIRTIKSCIYKTTGRKHYNYFEYVTLLSDVENCINSRPLTYLNEDTLDVVTPNSFLKCTTGRSLIFNNSSEEVSPPGQSDVIGVLQKREDMLQRFKDSWYDEYLLSLREASRDLYQPTWENKIAVGDIVLVSSNKTRNQWHMGRVTEILHGADEKTRCVRVVRPDRSEGVHSINLLYPLELSVATEHYKTKDHNSNINAEAIRPKRAAAIKCLHKLKECN